jgi:hypothetical protein
MNDYMAARPRGRPDTGCIQDDELTAKLITSLEMMDVVWAAGKGRGDAVTDSDDEAGDHLF